MESFYDKEHAQRNLMAWADITTLCIELRKAKLKAEAPQASDEELTRRVFAEAIKCKEQNYN